MKSLEEKRLSFHVPSNESSVGAVFVLPEESLAEFFEDSVHYQSTPRAPQT
jgi:hypothetical protein